MRIVLDTNLLVSLALVQGGRLAPVWDAWREGRFEVMVCDALLTGDHALQALERFGEAVVAAPTDFLRALEQA